MSDSLNVIESELLSDGKRVEIHRIKLKGVRKPKWSVIVMQHPQAPDITRCEDKKEAYDVYTNILREDVLEL